MKMIRLVAAALSLGFIATQAQSQTIADLALDAFVQDGEFGSLLTALDRAGLLETVADPTAELTVFAPNDAAFEKLGLNPGIIRFLPPRLLEAILLVHVAPGTLLSGDVVASDSIMMINGQSVAVRTFRDGQVVLIGRAQPVALDLVAENGVIHVIDAVLLPRGL